MDLYLYTMNWFLKNNFYLRFTFMTHTIFGMIISINTVSRLNWINYFDKK